jgi:hypothetical protein
VEDIRSTGGIEDVRTPKETRKCLTIVAVADEPEAAASRNDICCAMHVAAAAAERNAAIFCHATFSLIIFWRSCSQKMFLM